MTYYTFPIKPGTKLPAVKDWPNRAKPGEPAENTGIFTGKYGDDEALLVVDVDIKPGKAGDETLIGLELAGYDFPPTATQATPSGGTHYIYRTRNPVRSGVNVLGPGLDIRSAGGYIVHYGITGEPVPAPDWLVQRCGLPSASDSFTAPAVENIDAQAAVRRAKDYLASAPLAIEGMGGDATTYKVAATLKDTGISSDDALDLLLAEWNPRCEPPWTHEELAAKVSHAWKYGKNPPGVAAVEAQFVAEKQQDDFVAETQHPLDDMNSQFALVIAGGGAHVLRETTVEGKFSLEHWSLGAFHAWHANRPFPIGKRTVPMSQAWLEYARRRQYQRIVFNPRNDHDFNEYNLWRGFSVKPADDSAHWSVDMWVEHLRENVCNGDAQLYAWLLGYFAHLVQRPWEKPLVALVFRGAKGVGKNALVERVGALVDRHSLVTSDRRYLVGNFNGHLENCLLFILDEAFWSGDKQAEGIVKNLITGRQHVIEHKGKEPYSVSNLTRVVIIGNEDWLVPATADERRFAVFDVAPGRKQDRDFFQRMREGMEQGGYAHLLRFLLDQEVSDVNAAPNTSGLADQKTQSLDPIAQWWFDCLTQGQVIGLVEDEWPERVTVDSLWTASNQYAKNRNIRARSDSVYWFGRAFQRFGCAINKTKLDKRNAYRLPTLDECRVAWDTFIGHPGAWNES